MHNIGSHATLKLIRPNGGKNECLLDIPKWDFHWQGSYYLAQSTVVNPGDILSIECHWDNSQAHQPVQNGTQAPPKDLYWGEGTGDEMCLGGFYITRP